MHLNTRQTVMYKNPQTGLTKSLRNKFCGRLETSKELTCECVVEDDKSSNCEFGSSGTSLDHF